MHPFSRQNAHGMPLLGHVVVAGESWKRKIVATIWVNARLQVQPTHSVHAPIYNMMGSSASSGSGIISTAAY